MKYIKITGDLAIGTDNLTRDDLVRAKDHTYDLIINRIEETVYDPIANIWLAIKNIDEA